MSTLYQLTSPSGKSYIGISSKTTDARWAKHVEHALGKRENGALYSALRKYGTDMFQVKTLVIADDWEYLCQLEQKAIRAFNTKAPNGYNITDGGEGTVGRVITAQERERISAGQKKRFERPEERERMIAMAKRAHEANKKRHAAKRVDGLAPWEQRKREAAVRNGSPEHKEIVSSRTREAMAEPEVKAKVLAAAQRRTADPEWRKKISATKTGATVSHTAEGDAARLAGIKAAWADPVKKAARIEKIRATRARKEEQRNG